MSEHEPMPVLPSVSDPTFREQMRTWWLRQSDLLRQDGNEALALKTDAWASTWEYGGVLDLEA